MDKVYAVQVGRGAQYEVRGASLERLAREMPDAEHEHDRRQADQQRIDEREVIVAFLRIVEMDRRAAFQTPDGEDNEEDRAGGVARA